MRVVFCLLFSSHNLFICLCVSHLLCHSAACCYTFQADDANNPTFLYRSSEAREIGESFIIDDFRWVTGIGIWLFMSKEEGKEYLRKKEKVREKVWFERNCFKNSVNWLCCGLSCACAKIAMSRSLNAQTWKASLRKCCASSKKQTNFVRQMF